MKTTHLLMLYYADKGKESIKVKDYKGEMKSIAVVSIGLFFSQIFCFRTMEYIRSSLSFPLVKS